MTFVFSEDREDIGLRLAVSSLVQQCGNVSIVVFRPNPDTSFLEWARKFPNVRVIPKRSTGAYIWNCKPQTILELFDEGEDEVIWLDADIFVARNPLPFFRQQPSELIVVGQEPGASGWKQGSRLRTEGWKLPVGREWVYTLNTCVVRATKVHRPFLLEWAKYLQHPDYVHWQYQGFAQRPIHLAGDQDIFNALIGSEQFADLPVIVMRSGREIIHSGGMRTFSLNARIRSMLAPKPYFIHSLGAKPWIVLRERQRNATMREWLTMVTQELSPYVALAGKSQYRQLEPYYWLIKKSAFSRFCIAVSCGHFGLRGVVLTALAEAVLLGVKIKRMLLAR